MGGKSKSKAQVSAYLMSLHVGFCHSVDKVLEIFVKEKSVVKGHWSTNTALTINQKNLFGGEKKEGGLVGGLEIMQGRSDQVMREDLANRLGKTAATAPGFRDILSLFFYGAPGKGFLWSHNYPYLHTIWAKVTRTETGWYSAKREILLRSSGETTPTVAWDNQYKYQLSYGQTTFGVPSAFTEPGYDDSGWPTAPGGFANNGAAIGGRPIGTPIVSGVGNSIWLRKRVIVTGYPAGITLTLYHDDGCRLWWNGTELAGPGVGASRLTIPASLVLPENVVVYQVIDGVPSGTAQGFGADISVSVGSVTTNEYDMNPAHIIRECLTNTDWGMGLPVGQIDDTAFAEAADILYDEGFGLSLMWSGQSDIETFVNEVLNHIDATYGVDPATGKIFIKLIRGGYALGDLELLNEDNCRITQFNRKALDETTNEVVVTWTNPDNEGEETVVVHDLANYAAQGVIVSSSRNYYGIRSAALAIRAALRELNKSAQPIAAFEIEASRVAWKFKSGDVVKVTYAEYGLNELPCRITNINYGKPGEMAIKITLIEDVFEMPESSYVVTEGSYWEPVVSAPASVDHVYGTTAPYFAVARAMGDAEASTLTSTQAYSFLLADSAGLVEVFRPSTDAAGAVSYASAGTVDPCGYGTLGAGLIQEVTSTVTLASNSNRVSLASGVFMLIGGQEICIVESISPLVVRRGMLDTIPKVWAAGTSVWIFSWDADLNDETENLVGSSVSYQLAPDGTGGANHKTTSVTFSTRAVKPYRPADVKINGIRWPSVVLGPITVSWAHRNRLMETSVPLKWDEASVTPEVGTTYNVAFYSDEVLVRIESITGVSSGLTYTEETGSSVIDPYESDVVVRITLIGGSVSDDKGHTVTTYGGCSVSNFLAPAVYNTLSFDGTGDYLVVSASPDFAVGTGDFCVEGKFYFTGFATNSGLGSCLFDLRPYGSLPLGFALFVNSSGVLTADDVNSVWRTSLSGMVTTGQLYHISASRKSGVMTIAVDGKACIQYDSTYNYNPTSTTFIIGAVVDYLDSSANYKLKGYADDIRFTKNSRYDNSPIFPQAEVDPYEANVVLRMPMENLLDEKGHTVTAYGDVAVSNVQVKQGTYSARFDGTGDYLTLASSTDFAFGTGGFTVETWAYLESYANYRTVFDSREAHPSTTGFVFGVDGSGRFYLYTNGSFRIQAGYFPLNRWNKIKLTRQGDVFTGYINEVPVGTYTWSANLTRSSGVIGCSWPLDSLWVGYLDYFQITKDVGRGQVALFDPPPQLGDGALSIGGRMRVTLESTRDGLHSEQMFDHTFDRAGYGLQYGNYYGGI